MNKKVYLGDGVFAEYNGFHIVLSTCPEVVIYLEDSVFYALLDFAKKIEWMASDPCNRTDP